MLTIEQGNHNLLHRLIRYIIYLYNRLALIWRPALKVEPGHGQSVVLDRFQQRVEMNIKAEQLLGDYGTSILRMAYSYLHSLADAEDVLQDTLIQYLKAAPRIENTAHEKAWLLRVAVNLSKNKISYNKRHDTIELNEEVISAGELDLQFVWEAVSGLPVMYSEVLHLFYHEGCSTAQIAELLAKKESTIRSLLHRAREKLKIILKEEYDFAE
ncbi:RNA polymerase sigma factor [Paenibacillus sp. FSL M7-1046]|uniref:RNA polymerase sigma factor n=1 Tax=Paenibacillus sp. FSL M7-1046 TaxID=2975315 RepID=UPI0030FB4016